MIKHIEIENFKCLDHISVKLAPMTVLAGLNGMGKSTFMQALLVLHQSAIDSKFPLRSLVCKGPWADLGRHKDVLWEGAESETITFKIMKDHGPLHPKGLRFTLDEETGEFTAEEKYSDCVSTSPVATPSGLFSDSFHYLRAERWGPRISLPVSNESVRIHRQLGHNGEYTAQYLSEFGTINVENKRLHHPKAESAQLIRQAEAWLGEISPGTRLYADSYEDLDVVSLNYAFASGSVGETNHYRATNVGFGISYALPIIVAALTGGIGTLLLIENPEAHLHPRGQRKIAELLALAASEHMQIIVETHSDHFLNGLRLSAHSGRVKPKDIQLHYFEREQTDYAIRAKVSSPKIDRNGRIDYWPDGFFDENEKALRELLRPAKG